MPLLVFAPGHTQLIATGSLRSCDPDRLIIKRIILTGYVFKVNKKTVIARFMFYNPDDIRWFQKVQLWTKHGRRYLPTCPLYHTRTRIRTRAKNHKKAAPFAKPWAPTAE